jgi:hypothetical protein
MGDIEEGLIYLHQWILLRNCCKFVNLFTIMYCKILSWNPSYKIIFVKLLWKFYRRFLFSSMSMHCELMSTNESYEIIVVELEENLFPSVENFSAFNFWSSPLQQSPILCVNAKL